MHSPSAPTCVIAWPQDAQTRTAPSRVSTALMRSGLDRDSAAHYRCPSDRTPCWLPPPEEHGDNVAATWKVIPAGCPRLSPIVALLVVGPAAALFHRLRMA